MKLIEVIDKKVYEEVIEGMKLEDMIVKRFAEIERYI